MLNILINLGLESVSKRSVQASPFISSTMRHTPLDTYPVLRSALNHAEQRGLLEGERRRLVARLPSYASPR